MAVLFDGHLDLAMNALLYERDQTLSIPALRKREARPNADDRGIATVTLPELRRCGVAAVVATLIARAKPWVDPARRIGRMDLDYPDARMAYAAAQGQLAYYRLLEAQGELRIMTTAGALARQFEQAARVEPALDVAGPGGATGRSAGTTGGLPANTGATGGPPTRAAPEPGVILLMEGADPIVEPAQVHAWHAAGLRALALAHYGHSRYAAGTPSPDPTGREQDGPLTELGVALLREARELPLAIDLSHLSDTSFYQVIDTWPGRVCASHTNCRALVPHPRQFSDEQIKLIVERDGVIGMVMYAGMIRPLARDGGRPVDVRLAHVVEHVDHVCQLAGSAKHVALGTDLDGGFGAEATPGDLQRYEDLTRLEPMLRDRGFDDADVAGFFHGNWLRFYSEVLGNA
ncbi:MAG: membrane dipeptidase [Phycisphaeraceae bacterium]